MEVTIKEVEELLGQKITEELFNEALKYAERKQLYSFDREKNPAIMQHWYLVTLTKEYVCNLAFSRFTRELCATLQNMEKEHPADSQDVPQDPPAAPLPCA